MTILYTLIAAIAFYAFPYLIGRTILRFFTTRDSGVISFVAGALTLFGGALLLNYAGVPLLGQPFNRLFTGLIIALISISAGVHAVSKKHRFSYSLDFLPIALSLLLATIAYGMWQFRSPYTLNWDIFEHQTLVNQILSGHYSFVTSHISDTFMFNGYSSLFHTLLAGAQDLFPLSLFVFWHGVSFIHLILTILASYFLGRSITGDERIGAASAVIGAFIFESTLAFTSMFLVPQTFTATIFVLLLCRRLTNHREGIRPSLWEMAIGSLFLVLTHYIIGTAALFLYGASYVYLFHRDTISRFISLRVLTVLAALALGIGIGVSYVLPLGFLNNGEAASYIYGPMQDFSVMAQVYGFLLILLLPYGAVIIWKRKHLLERFLLVGTFFMLAGMLSHIPYVLKFYVLLRYFVDVVLAIGIVSLVTNIQVDALRRGAYAVFTAVLIIVLLGNTIYWKGFLAYGDLYTHIAPNDVRAANFLREHYTGTNTLLVSDPATQGILEALSGVNTQGGVYESPTTRTEVAQLNSLTDPEAIAQTVYQINDSVTGKPDTYLLALSGRYFLWQQASDKDKYAYDFNIWPPSDLTFSNLRAMQPELSNTNYFRLVYKDPTMAIFEVRK